MGIEQAAAQLQKEHINLSQEIDSLKKEIRDNEAILRDLNNKFNEANKILDKLEDENNELKENAQDFHDKSISHINESKNQER